MQAEPDQALPILQKLLASNNSDKIKDTAMFVLTQSSSPQAAKLLGDIARGNANPKLADEGNPLHRHDGQQRIAQGITGHLCGFEQH